MNQAQLAELFEIAKQVAQSAGEIIDSYRTIDVPSAKKGDTGSLAADIVTAVDLEVQEHIEQVLKPVNQQYDLAFLGEERTDDRARFDKAYFWAVDPIDGTLCFCHKEAGYSVSIALVSRAGEAVIGVVYDPLNKQCYAAAKGLGATINEKKIIANSAGSAEIESPPKQPHQTQDSNRQPKRVRCYLDRSYLEDPRYQPIIESLRQCVAANTDRQLDVCIGGGAALTACWTACEAPALYFKLPKPCGGSIWDYAATTCFFQVLGLTASDLFGEPLALNRQASTYLNHKGVLFSTDAYLTDHMIKTIRDSEITAVE